MNSRGYTVLGWLVWQVGSRVAKRKMAQNRVKLGAAGVIALVALGGILAARGERSESYPRLTGPSPACRSASADRAGPVRD